MKKEKALESVKADYGRKRTCHLERHMRRTLRAYRKQETLETGVHDL